MGALNEAHLFAGSPDLSSETWADLGNRPLFSIRRLSLREVDACIEITMFTGNFWLGGCVGERVCNLGFGFGR